jgi:hypothetical protein
MVTVPFGNWMFRRRCDATCTIVYSRDGEPYTQGGSSFIYPAKLCCIDRTQVSSIQLIRVVMVGLKLGVHGEGEYAERKSTSSGIVVRKFREILIKPNITAKHGWILYTSRSDIRGSLTIVAYHCDMVARLITTLTTSLVVVTQVTPFAKITFQISQHPITTISDRQLPIVDAEINCVSYRMAVRL